MKRITKLILAIFALTFITVPASAQFRWGIHAGIVANDLKFNSKVFDASNRVGFTGGLTAQFDLPLGFAVQGSVDYVHRTSSVDGEGSDKDGKWNVDYLAVPIHLKYNIGIPAIKDLFRPFLFTGPSFSYRISKATRVSKGDIEWDLGFGADIVKHIQLSVGYGIGCYSIMDWGGKVRTNSWTITLGYLF